MCSLSVNQKNNENKSLLPNFLREVAVQANLQKNPNVRQFVIQHLFADTMRLLLESNLYFPIENVISIPYSGKESVIQELRNNGIPVVVCNNDDLESVVFRELEQCLKKSLVEGYKIIIHEVGGTAICVLHEKLAQYIPQVLGVVEITKQGVWQAQKLTNLQVPQLNCAETKLKKLEGYWVGESVVSAVNNILRDCGVCLAGREALVLGYGWVGRGVSLSLQNCKMNVTVAEKDIIKQVELILDGFNKYDSNYLKNIKLVIGASGVLSINEDILKSLPNKCMIASASSKRIEIDMEFLTAITVKEFEIHKYLKALELIDGRTIYLFNNGYPVNFTGPSVQDEIVEFLFGEALLLLDLAAKNTYEPGIYPLPEELERIPAQVWINLR